MGESSSKPEALRAAIGGAHILVVDDSGMNQQVAAAALKEAGLKVTLADNGMDAVVLLDSQSFDAILMDTQMPVMDGFQATQIIRLMPDCGDVPIIAVTASDKQDNQEKFLAAGMSDFVVRSMDPEGLYKVLERWVMPGEYV